MEKTDAAALARVICRAIDYFHVRRSAEGIQYASDKDQIDMAVRLQGSQDNVAAALEEIPD